MFRHFENLECEPQYLINDGHIATRTVLFEKFQPFKLIIKSSPIGVATRRLRALWTPELAQDLEAYHSINAEQELTDLLFKELRNQSME